MIVTAAAGGFAEAFLELDRIAQIAAAAIKAVPGSKTVTTYTFGVPATNFPALWYELPDVGDGTTKRVDFITDEDNLTVDAVCAMDTKGDLKAAGLLAMRWLDVLRATYSLELPQSPVFLSRAQRVGYGFHLRQFGQNSAMHYVVKVRIQIPRQSLTDVG